MTGFSISYDTVEVDFETAQSRMPFRIRFPAWLPAGYSISATVRMCNDSPTISGDCPAGIDVAALAALFSPAPVCLQANHRVDKLQNLSLTITTDSKPLSSDEFKDIETIDVSGHAAQRVRYKRAHLFHKETGWGADIESTRAELHCTIASVTYQLGCSGEMPDDVVRRIMASWAPIP